MARALNKNRLRLGRYGLMVMVLVSLFTTPMIGEDTWIEVLFDLVGNALVFACALGRVYCTAFLGGHKNEQIIDYGPFSITRNPLYMCTFIGVCGTVMIAGYLTMMVVIPLWYWIVYHALIRREEAFLEAQFGDVYRTYCSRTPRLIPQFHLYRSPATIEMRTPYLNKALRDSVLWFSILPMFEIIRWCQESGVIPTLLVLP